MSAEQFEPGTPPRSWQPEETPKNDQLVPFFNIEGDYVLYPDFLFLPEARRIIGNDTIEVSPEARLRYALGLLASTCGEDYPHLAHVAEPSVRDTELKNARNYLSGVISIKSLGRSIKRDEIINSEEALNLVYLELKEENHPAFQLQEQIESSFRNDLDAPTLRRLKNDIVTVVAWPRLKHVYAEQLDKWKKIEQNPNNSNL